MWLRPTIWSRWSKVWRNHVVILKTELIYKFTINVLFHDKMYLRLFFQHSFLKRSWITNGKISACEYFCCSTISHTDILINVFNKWKDAGVFVFMDVKYTHVEKVIFVLMSFYNVDNFGFSMNNLWFSPDGELLWIRFGLGNLIVTVYIFRSFIFDKWFFIFFIYI